MKGQYFSFDAIIATVIMVLAFSSLISYWYGAQAVVEDRVGSRLADANRIAETLLSPGSPEDWDDEDVVQDMGDIRQIGIATGFNNELDLDKVDLLEGNADPNVPNSNYEAVGNLMRAGGNYYVVIERTDSPGEPIAMIGKPYPDKATYVAVANRGVTYSDASGSHPARMRVFLWNE